MSGQVNITLQNWEKISEEHQKLYKNFLAKAREKCRIEGNTGIA